MLVRVKESKYKIFLWLICAFMCFLIENIFADGFVYDAADYWCRGEALWADGRLNILGTSGFRGYIFPLFLGTCNHYAGELGWRVINAAMISTIFTMIVPYLSGGGKMAECWQ